MSFYNQVKEFLLKPKFKYSNRFRGLSLNAREVVLKIVTMFIYANKVKGDYFEFGVYKGTTFTAAYYFAKLNFLYDMRFLAFDSFEGLPEIKGVDAKVPMYEAKQYAFGLDKFKQTLKKNEVDLNKVDIFPGWFDKVLNDDLKKKFKAENKKAAIVWIDSDLYESAVLVLDFIKDFLVDGSIILFDDWFCFNGNPGLGEQKAFNEWLVKNSDIKASQFHKFGWHGQSFIIHKAN